MKKSIFVLVFLLVFPHIVQAQEKNSVRSMAVDQLYQYGEAIYDRGDYPQAAQIFTRILAMNPSHAAAIGYAKKLNQKGEHITIPEAPAVPTVVPVAPTVPAADVVAPKPVKKHTKAMVRHPAQKPVEKSVEKIVSHGTGDDLKQDIQEADEAIEQLKGQVADLRDQISQGQKDLAQ